MYQIIVHSEDGDTEFFKNPVSLTLARSYKRVLEKKFPDCLFEIREANYLNILNSL